MKTYIRNIRNNRYNGKIFGNIIVYICLFISISVMMSWFTDIKFLQHLMFENASMKFNTALMLFFSSLNFLLLEKRTRLNLRIYFTLTSILISIGLLTLIEYVGINSINIDNLFVYDYQSVEFPGRMSPATAVCSLLTGLGFLGIQNQNKKLSKFTLYCSKITFLISFTSIISYLLLISVFDKTIFFKTMAIHTSILFFGLSILQIMKSPQSKIKEMIVSDLNGSSIFRKLLPIIVFFPVLMGVIIITMIDKNLLSIEFSIVLYTVIVVPINIIYIMFIATGLNRKDEEQRFLEEELLKSYLDMSQFKLGLDQIAIVVRTDENGTITYTNNEFCKISKYSREEVIGKNHNILSSGYHSDEFFKSMWKIIQTGKIWKGEIKNMNKFGEYFWIDTAIIPFRDTEGKIVEYLAISRDSTQRKENELLKLKYVNELEYKNEELEQYAYVASHDLQEPLNTIINYVKLLLDEYNKKFDEVGNKSLQFILAASKRMKDLIKNLLEYSKLDKNASLDTIDLNILIKEIEEDLKQIISKSKAEISYSKLPIIKIYSFLFKTLFQNLITNAIKFCKEETIPKIHISANLSNDVWTFSIKDNGIGIDEHYKDKVFIIFQRLHGRNEYDGTGIGLAQCKKVVDLHGGKIWVESVINEGSTFYFTIPSEIK